MLGVICATNLEYEVLKEQMSLSIEEKLRESYDCAKGEYCGYEIIVVKCRDTGAVNAALATSDLINLYRPNLVILVGMAGGNKRLKVKIGDVIFGQIVIAYEYDKREGTIILPRARHLN